MRKITGTKRIVSSRKKKLSYGIKRVENYYKNTEYKRRGRYG